jgi:lipoyl(octanoyl) transferase
MRETWRVIHDPPMPGQYNMERDLSLHREVSRGAPPTLRFYRWDPPAVSLGRFQKPDEVVDAAACRRRGIDIVRRPTGGRALLHHRELTYSLAVPESHPLIPSSILEAYKIFSLALIRGFAGLGIRASLAPGENRGRGLAPGACFDTPSAYEIQIDGKKVVGSAQLRRHGALLQHGAVLLGLSLDLYQEILKPAPRPGPKDACLESLADRAAGLHDLGYAVEPAVLAQALQTGFSLALGVDFLTEKGV